MSSRPKYLVGGRGGEGRGYKVGQSRETKFSRFSSLKQSAQRFCMNVHVITIRERFKKLVDMWVLDLIVLV
jgi:hypothetical protein